MKVILIATVTANGQLLLTENSNKVTSPPQVFDVFMQHSKAAGNIVMGHNTYRMIRQVPAMKALYSGIEVVVLSRKAPESPEYKVVATPEEAVAYLESKGLETAVVAGGLQAYNSFLDSGLVTDLYFSTVPVIIGDGGVLRTREENVLSFKLAGQHLLTPEVIQLHYSKA